jgi:hypothetical protein
MEVICTRLLCGCSLGDGAGLLASSFVRSSGATAAAVAVRICLLVTIGASSDQCAGDHTSGFADLWC